MALLSCEPVVMPRITSRFVLGPVEEKLKPGTNPAKSFKSRALICSKVPEVSAVTLLGTFWMDSEKLASVPEAERTARATSLLKARTGKKYNVVRLEVIVDSEQEIKGYMAFTTP